MFQIFKITIKKKSDLLNLSRENNFKHNTPIIFNKKLNKSKIQKLEYIYTDTGRIKHFPPAAQE
jgi:hypothetical protein